MAGPTGSRQVNTKTKARLLMYMLSDIEQELLWDEELTVLRSATAVVHLEYEPKALPLLAEVAEQHSHRDSAGEWTRFVCISDTHTRSFEVPNGDVLLHSGDLTKLGTEAEFKKTMQWLYSLPHKVKIVIAGNHDLPLHRPWYEGDWKRWHDKRENYGRIIELMNGQRAQGSGIIYLQNESTTFQLAEGRRAWSVYGSPWSPEFFNWAFNYKEEEAEDLISSFPNTDILLTHGPPAKIFDQTRSGELVGCPALASHLSSGRLRPRLHAFGHIHESHGAHIHSWEHHSAPCAAPEMQNDLTYPIELSASDSDSEEAEVERIRSQSEQRKKEAEERNWRFDMQRTVFVNAANEPAGRTTWKNGRKVTSGGPNFRPVVVDLKD